MTNRHDLPLIVIKLYHLLNMWYLSCIDIGDITETLNTKELSEDFSIIAYIPIMSLVTNIIQSFNPTYVHITLIFWPGS